MKAKAVEVKGLTRRFGSLAAVDGISLESIVGSPGFFRHDDGKRKQRAANLPASPRWRLPESDPRPVLPCVGFPRRLACATAFSFQGRFFPLALLQKRVHGRIAFLYTSIRPRREAAAGIQATGYAENGSRLNR